MDRRNWPWRKRSSEKVSGMAEQGETMPAPLPAPAIISSPSPAPTPAHEEQGLEEKVKTINSQLSAALVESKAKDDLVKQHAKVAEEAVSGWEKAEAEAVSMKEERDVALQQKVAAEDRVCHLDGALKECMRQLRQVREEHEQKIHDVVMKKANELDRIRTELEEQLAGINHQLLEAAAENTVLRKSLQEKTQIIEQLSERKTYVEADFKVLQVKLNSLEKENSALRYELHVLNKELEIRNEEKEYNRRSTDAANKQFIESTKKIAKLETECQRLRVLVRKKLPGPAAIAQMKMEVEMLGKDAVEGKRKRMGKGAGLTSLAGESMHDNAQENSFKTAETAKVKFFPSHSVAGLRSGVPLKASSKSNAADENPNIASPRTGMVNSRPFSPRNISSTVTDSSGPPVNRSGLQSFSRQTIVNSGSRSVGLSNSNDALPSFLLSSRSNNSSRVNSVFRSSTEAGSGNGAGPLSGTKGNMKSNSSRISFPASSSYLKDSQNLTSRNSEVKGILKQSAGKFLVDESKDEKSDADYSAFSSIPTQGNCKLDESTPPFKGNLPLTLESAEQKPSTVVAKVLQPQKLASVELKGSAMAIEIPKGSMLTKKVVKDNASTECLNLPESVKEDPDGINLKQMEGGLNTCELSHKDNTKQLIQQWEQILPHLANQEEASNNGAGKFSSHKKIRVKRPGDYWGEYESLGAEFQAAISFLDYWALRSGRYKTTRRKEVSRFKHKSMVEDDKSDKEELLEEHSKYDRNPCYDTDSEGQLANEDAEKGFCKAFDGGTREIHGENTFQQPVYKEVQILEGAKALKQIKEKLQEVKGEIETEFSALSKMDDTRAQNHERLRRTQFGLAALRRRLENQVMVASSSKEKCDEAMNLHEEAIARARVQQTCHCPHMAHGEFLQKCERVVGTMVTSVSLPYHVYHEHIPLPNVFDRSLVTGSNAASQHFTMYIGDIRTPPKCTVVETLQDTGNRLSLGWIDESAKFERHVMETTIARGNRVSSPLQSLGERGQLAGIILMEGFAGATVTDGFSAGLDDLSSLDRHIDMEGGCLGTANCGGYILHVAKRRHLNYQIFGMNRDPGGVCLVGSLCVGDILHIAKRIHSTYRVFWMNGFVFDPGGNDDIQQGLRDVRRLGQRLSVTGLVAYQFLGFDIAIFDMVMRHRDKQIGSFRRTKWTPHMMFMFLHYCLRTSNLGKGGL